MPKASKKLTSPRSAKIKTDKKIAPAKRAPRPKPIVAAKPVRTPPKLVKPVVEPSESKQSAVLRMLGAPTGTTVAAIMTATGWQQHSVRGFFAGVVRKKLKLNLTSAPSEDGRIYRITDGIVISAGVAGAVTSTRTAA